MKYKKSVFRTMSLITQLGISMLAPIFLCVYVGQYLDQRFGWSTFVPLLIMGILAGGKNAHILAMRIVKDSEKDKSRDI